MTDLSSDELKEISEWYPSGITAVISTNKVSQMARELLQRREAAEGKPYAYEFVTKGKLLGKVCLKRVLPPVDVIDVTPLWRQPPLNSAERERLATLERVVEGLPQDAIDGGWTAVGIIAYAKSLQSELAALRQAQQEQQELEAQLKELNANFDTYINRNVAERYQKDAANNALVERCAALESELAALSQAQQGPSTAANSTAVADSDLTAALCDLAYANDAGNSPVIPDVPAIRDVIAERRRQITAEGWTPEHDNAYSGGELARAAACYAVMSVREEFLTEEEYAVTQKRLPFDWPWEPEWWKPTSSRRDLVKAGALILAEIERIDRCATQSKGGK